MHRKTKRVPGARLQQELDAIRHAGHWIHSVRAVDDKQTEFVIEYTKID